MSDIVDRINEENAERFGPLCENCKTFDNYCRCESAKKFEQFMKTGVDTRIFNINIEPIAEGDVAEYIKRITAYFKKPVEFVEDEETIN